MVGRALLVVVVGMLLLAPSAGAVIVYEVARSGTDIYAARDNGSRARLVKHVDRVGPVGARPSPDGRLVAYQGRSKGRRALAVRRLSDRRLAFRTRACWWPIGWASPTVVVCRGSQGIVRVDLESKRATTPVVGRVRRAALSPDGSLVAWQRRSASGPVRVTPLLGGGSRLVVADGGEGFAWCGGSIAYPRTSDDGEGEVWLAAAEGSSDVQVWANTTGQLGDYLTPVDCSADGSRILTRWNFGGPFDISIGIETSTGAWRDIVAEEAQYSPLGISRDGRSTLLLLLQFEAHAPPRSGPLVIAPFGKGRAKVIARNVRAAAWTR